MHRAASSTLPVAMAVAAALSAASTAQAQEPIETPEVVVTGSRVLRTDTETPSPVQIITRDDLERSGQKNIGDVLRQVSADNQGSLSSAFTAGFAAGAAGISLRGLGLNSTLVLLNGRRMTNYGLADDGARTFVDLNSLPLEAVERVEVVKDGASAIYGSDAVAGVVNIILRETYKGASLSADLGQSTESDGALTRVDGSWGMGDLQSDRYNFFVTSELSREQAIMQRDRRDYLGTNDLSRFGFFDNRRGAFAQGFDSFFVTDQPGFNRSTPYGAVAIPNTPAGIGHYANLASCPEIGPSGMCLWDDIDFIQVQPRTERVNVYARGNYKLTDNMTGYLEAGWFHSKVEAIGTPGNLFDGGVYNPADPANPLVVHTAVLPANHPDNPFGEDLNVRQVTTFLGGRNFTTNNDVERFVLGVKGAAFSDWTYDVGGAYVDTSLHRTQTGFINFDAMQAALDNGTFRFDPSLMSQETIDSFSPLLKDNPKNSLLMFDGSLTGSLFDLPGGRLGVAVGTEWRKEKTETPPVPGTETSQIVGLGYSAFSADRDVSAAYIELNAPVLKSVEVDAAFRHDHYSDYGNSNTPKVGVKWQPIPQVALRGTYAEAFRAPGPTESGNASSLGFTNIAIVSIGDPSVKPETAKNYTYGIVLQPFSGTSATVDYYRIDRRNEITPADQATILAGIPVTGAPSSNVPGAVPKSFAYYDDEGNLSAVSGPYANLNSTRTRGLDIDLRQTFDLGPERFQARALWTRVFHFERTLADGTKLEYADTHGPFVLSSAGGTPRDRGTLEVTWVHNDASLTARANYVSGMQLIDHQGEVLQNFDGNAYITSTFESSGGYFVANPNGLVCAVYNPDGTPFHGDCRMPSFTTIDLVGKMAFGQHLDVSASVANLFDRMAPFDPYTYGGLNYNPAFDQAGALGRYMTVSARYRF
jgi:iron complex outermembrane recepter protein